jgi:hypothetical protein
MARYEQDYDRGRPMGWGEERDDFRRSGGGRRMGDQGGSAAWDRGAYGGMGSYEGQGEYGGQGSWAQGEFRGQGRTQYQPQGYGEDYMAQGIGWQGGERFARGPETRTHTISHDDRQFGRYGAGGYGQEFGRLPESQGFGGQGMRGRQGTGSPVTGFYYEEIWLIPGPHSGRGPQGYRRGDDRIEEDVCERLTQAGQLDASNIEVRVENGEVTLSGTVESRRDKRLAEDVIESVSGVQDVHNQIRVQRGEGRDQDQVISQGFGQSDRSGADRMAAESGSQSSRARQSQRRETTSAGAAGS